MTRDMVSEATIHALHVAAMSTPQASGSTPSVNGKTSTPIVITERISSEPQPAKKRPRKKKEKILQEPGSDGESGDEAEDLLELAVGGSSGDSTPALTKKPKTTRKGKEKPTGPLLPSTPSNSIPVLSTLRDGIVASLSRISLLSSPGVNIPANATPTSKSGKKVLGKSKLGLDSSTLPTLEMKDEKKYLKKANGQARRSASPALGFASIADGLPSSSSLTLGPHLSATAAPRSKEKKPRKSKKERDEETNEPVSMVGAGVSEKTGKEMPKKRQKAKKEVKTTLDASLSEGDGANDVESPNTKATEVDPEAGPIATSKEAAATKPKPKRKRKEATPGKPNGNVPNDEDPKGDPFNTAENAQNPDVRTKKRKKSKQVDQLEVQAEENKTSEEVEGGVAVLPAWKKKRTKPNDDAPAAQKDDPASNPTTSRPTQDDPPETAETEAPPKKTSKVVKKDAPTTMTATEVAQPPSNGENHPPPALDGDATAKKKRKTKKDPPATSDADPTVSDAIDKEAETPAKKNRSKSKDGDKAAGDQTVGAASDSSVKKKKRKDKSAESEKASKKP